MLNYKLDDLLRGVFAKNASDLHLRVGDHPVFRIHGHLVRQTEYPILEEADTREIMYAIMSPRQLEGFERERILDMAYEVPDLARFRVNCFWQQGKVGAVLRMIPIEIRSIETLGLPQILKEFADLPRGLILVTGPTGSGKSTTLAAMVDHINETRRAHIVTIEDPIEFLHRDKTCAIEQREVGQDTTSFSEALRHVMRATPDIILVGEMRDLETIALAITAAETGHLVFATLHTTDAMQTIDRAVDVFPPGQQSQVRMQLSVTLGGVICQALLPLKDRPGRACAFEIMRATPAIRAVIREGKTHMIYNLIQSGADQGMIVLDQYLSGLVKNNVVDYENALAKSSYPKEFARRCGIVQTTED